MTRLNMMTRRDCADDFWNGLWNDGVCRALGPSMTALAQWTESARAEGAALSGEGEDTSSFFS